MTEQIHDAFLQIVLSGHGLVEVAARLAEAIRGPVVIIAPGGEVLASAQADALWSGPESPISVTLTAQDDRVLMDGREVTCFQAPVYAGSRLHGRVLAMPPSNPTPDDRQAMEAAATAAAFVLAMQAEVVAQEQKYQSDLMHQLLRGSITEAQDVVRRSEPFGWDLARRVIVLVIEHDDTQQITANEARPTTPLAVRTLVLSRDPQAAVVRLGAEVVVVTEAFPWENGRQNALKYAQSLQRVATRAYGASVSVGMSRPVTQVLDIPLAYDQAVTALRVGRRLHSRGVASHINELGVERVLSLVEDHEELRSFAHEVLGELDEGGERAADLRRTLEVLLETNVNVAESARRLHYHYNTLRFRIDKLERIVGPFRDDARVRLNLHLALLIQRLVNPPA